MTIKVSHKYSCMKGGRDFIYHSGILQTIIDPEKCWTSSTSKRRHGGLRQVGRSSGETPVRCCFLRSSGFQAAMFTTVIACDMRILETKELAFSRLAGSRLTLFALTQILRTLLSIGDWPTPPISLAAQHLHFPQSSIISRTSGHREKGKSHKSKYLLRKYQFQTAHLTA